MCKQCSRDKIAELIDTLEATVPVLDSEGEYAVAALVQQAVESLISRSSSAIRKRSSMRDSPSPLSDT